MAGRWSTRNVIPGAHARAVGEVVVVQHQVTSPGSTLSSLRRPASSSSVGSRPAWRSGRALAPTPGTARSSAVTTYVQNDEADASEASRDTHATAPASLSQVARSCRLAEPRRGRHQGDPAASPTEATVEVLGQPGPWHGPCPRRRHEQLGLEHPDRHDYSRPSARTCTRSPGRPKMLSTSAGPSPVEPNQCGTCVSNSAASPDAQDEIAVAEDQPHAAGQDVEPLEPVVSTRVRCRLRWRG